nr:unnamed protein product [Digitaria exilis]
MILDDFSLNPSLGAPPRERCQAPSTHPPVTWNVVKPFAPGQQGCNLQAPATAAAAAAAAIRCRRRSHPHFLMRSPSRAIACLLHLRRLSTSPRDHLLLLRFAAVAKELSEQPPTPPLPPRPRSPHPYDYNRLMSAHASSGDGDGPGAGAARALHLLDEMRSLLGRRPDTACFTTAAAALSSASEPGAAIAVLNAMANDGVAPDAVACTVLVGVYACRLQWFDEAYEVVRWMADNGVALDVVTYSTLISGLCSAGRVAEALGVLDLMLEQGCQPNAHTYTPIVHAYCSSKLEGAPLSLRELHRGSKELRRGLCRPSDELEGAMEICVGAVGLRRGPTAGEASSSSRQLHRGYYATGRSSTRELRWPNKLECSMVLRNGVAPPVRVFEGASLRARVINGAPQRGHCTPPSYKLEGASIRGSTVDS